MKKIILKYKIFFIIMVLLAGLSACKDQSIEIENINFPRPFSPTGLQVELTNLTNVSISWNPVENAAAYVVELYANDSLAFNPGALEKTITVQPADIPVKIEGLQKNLGYSVRVKAVNSDGTESKWEGMVFKTEEIKVKITEWNFSEGELRALADLSPNTFEDTKVINGLTLHAASGKSMRVVANVVSAGDYNFTHYIDLQGGGTDINTSPKNRCVSFEVTEPCIISVYANAGGSGRTLEAYTATEVIGTLIVPGNKADEPAKMMINWTGGKETIYIRSQGSGIYIYAVRVAVGEVYVPSNVSTFTKLAVSEGTMSPAFSSGVLDYTITVPNSTQSVTFTPTKGHAKQTINSSLTAMLTGGETEHRIEVVAEDGMTSSVYIFTIIREMISSDATLKKLVITGGGTFTPDFTPDVTDYVFTVDTAIHEVTMTGTANHPYATVGGSGITYSDLQLGNNGPFSITVISEDKTSVKNYLVTVRRFTPAAPSSNKEWNITEMVSNGLLSDGNIETEITVDDLTIFPTVTIDSNSKTVDGISFGKRLKLNGSGSITSRALKFNVTGACTITVYALSSSSSSNRVLNVDDGTTVLGTINALGSSSSFEIFNYTGGAGSLYFYSPSSGVNIYYVKVVYP
ncbi:MAG: cadherin-like beta sandwich domain-containing protein [Prolixibacteraceae bacterium]|jgi:hypothetical protein|nr:cadherin-like beta sandwich domain-containing protein [Prolixibacteraceae bacterium]